MKRLLIATTAVALLAGVGAASAQSWRYNDSYTHRGPFVERGVRLGLDPYNGSSPNQRTSSPDESYSYRSQEVWPQSPPSGGY